MTSEVSLVHCLLLLRFIGDGLFHCLKVGVEVGWALAGVSWRLLTASRTDSMSTVTPD
jgi:hypothetical protein